MRVHIQTCTGREAFCQSLVDRLPHAVVYKDVKKDPIATYIAMLTAADPANGLLCLEDDVILCDDFEAKLDAVVAEHGTTILSLFSTTADKTKVHGPSNFQGTQGTYFPAGIANQIAAFAMREWRPQAKVAMYQDQLCRDWMKHTGAKFRDVVPNLIQHREGKSAINPRFPQRRVTKTFIDDPK